MIDLRAIEDLLSPRAAAANRRFETPVLVISLLALPMLIIELAVTEGWPVVAAGVANWLIWTAVTAEFIVVFSLTDRRADYARRAWLYLAVILFAFPPVAAMSATGALVGAIRVLRAIFLLAVFGHSAWILATPFKHLYFDVLAIIRHPWMLFIRPVLKRRGLGLVAMAFALLAIVTGLFHALFEEQSVVEGLWWALVTLTTVGYGDFAPVTAGGRITASLLMLSGIGVLAFITASVAAFFVEGDYKKELRAEVRSINARLDRIEELLLSQRESPSARDD